jgi:hypothetical protein
LPFCTGTSSTGERPADGARSREAPERAAADVEADFQVGRAEFYLDYAQQCHKLAEWSLASGDRAQALAWANRTLAIYARLGAGDPNNEEVVSETISLDNVFGDDAAARRRPRAAAEWHSPRLTRRRGAALRDGGPDDCRTARESRGRHAPTRGTCATAREVDLSWHPSCYRTGGEC